MYYTGIGSRETPQSVMGVMEDAAFRLARMGWVLRSGKAAGADTAFQLGMQRYAQSRGGYNTETARLAEIYTPWARFNGGEGTKSDWDITLPYVDMLLPAQIDTRDAIVHEMHPAAAYMKEKKPGAYALHSRNVHQVLGMNLDQFRVSSFVLYFAEEDKKGNPKGGTATAVALAKSHNIRTLNLLHLENMEKLELFLESMEKKRGFTPDLPQ